MDLEKDLIEKEGQDIVKMTTISRDKSLTEDRTTPVERIITKSMRIIADGFERLQSLPDLIKFPETQKVEGQVEISGMDRIVKAFQSIKFPLVQKISGKVEVEFPTVQEVKGEVKADVIFPETQKVSGRVEADVEFPEIQKVKTDVPVLEVGGMKVIPVVGWDGKRLVPLGDGGHSVSGGGQVFSAIKELHAMREGLAYQALKITESGVYTYIAVAPPGTGESTPAWQAFRLDETSGLRILYADNGRFNQKATDLTALVYS